MTDKTLKKILIAAVAAGAVLALFLLWAMANITGYTDEFFGGYGDGTQISK